MKYLRLGDDKMIEAWKMDNGWEFKDSDVTTNRVN